MEATVTEEIEEQVTRPRIDLEAERAKEKEEARKALRNKIKNMNARRNNVAPKGADGKPLSKVQMQEMRTKGIDKMLEEYGITDKTVIAKIKNMIASGQVKDTNELMTRITDLLTSSSSANIEIKPGSMGAKIRAAAARAHVDPSLMSSHPPLPAFEDI